MFFERSKNKRRGREGNFTPVTRREKLAKEVEVEEICRHNHL
jgi:hypothetical protein